MTTLRAVFFAAIAHLVAALVIAFIPSSNLAGRYSAFLLIIPCISYAIKNTDPLASSSWLFNLYMCGFVLHAHCALCLMLVSSPSAPHTGQGRRSRFVWAVQSLFDPRNPLRKPRKINSTLAGEQPLSVSTITRSRCQCIAYHAWTLAWTVIFQTIINDGILLDLFATPTTYPDFHHSPPLLLSSLFTPFTQSAIKPAPSHTPFRIYVAVSSVSTSYLTLRAFHSLAALATLTIFSASPEDWQAPLFGPLSSATSLRAFFGSFWHTLMRRAFTLNAVWLVHDVLHVPRTPAFKKTAHIAILYTCFALSGVMHTVAAWPRDSPATAVPASDCGRNSNQLLYYMVFATSIVAEDWVCGFYVGAMKELGVSRSPYGLVARLERLVGYVWVFLWHVECLPRLSYPAMQCQLDGGMTAL